MKNIQNQEINVFLKFGSVKRIIIAINISTRLINSNLFNSLKKVLIFNICTLHFLSLYFFLHILSIKKNAKPKTSLNSKNFWMFFLVVNADLFYCHICSRLHSQILVELELCLVYSVQPLMVTSLKVTKA